MQSSLAAGWLGVPPGIAAQTIPNPRGLCAARCATLERWLAFITPYSRLFLMLCDLML